MNFNISGEYITTIARQWFYEERRPYKEVERLLLECMCGTDTPKKVLQGYAFDVINLTKKFVGETRDDSFGLVDEDDKEVEILRNKYPLYKYVDNLIESGKLPFEICEYGFISPSGDFIPVEWCQHAKFANDYVKANDLWGDTLKMGYLNCTDYLVYAKGYILLENPHKGRAKVHEPFKITKRQRETLYDYYMHFGRTQDAIDLFKEE